MTWLTRFKDNIKECRALYPACYDSLSTGFKRWWNQFLKKNWTVLNKSKMISEVDDIARYIYNSLIKYAVLQSKYNPILPTLVCIYPYDRRHSGVSICAYLVIEKAKKPVIFSNLFLRANDYLQSKDLRENVYDIQSEIQKALKASRLSKGAKLLISRGLQSFHAEYYWFTVRLQELVILIENNKNMFPNFSEKADEFLLLNLMKLPRLEFVMTTSPCKDCQDFLFKELRLTLNALNVKLPIIIFANSPYNTAEVNESPIAIVKNDGTYCVTGLMSKLPYYVKNQLRFINQSVVCKLFSEEQKIFFELDSVVNEFMPSIIVAPQVVKKHFFFSMMELFFEDGTVNWNTNRWTTWFFQRFGARVFTITSRLSYARFTKIAG
jgi:hypothetical protein